MKQEVIDKIKEHYNHAKQKHPYFCDKLTYDSNDDLAFALRMSRANLKKHIINGCVSFCDVLICEMIEALNEVVNDNTERAIEELLDMIAVCLRGIDVLEGRQALGDPEKKGE